MDFSDQICGHCTKRNILVDVSNLCDLHEYVKLNIKTSKSKKTKRPPCCCANCEYFQLTIKGSNKKPD